MSEQKARRLNERVRDTLVLAILRWFRQRTLILRMRIIGETDLFFKQNTFIPQLQVICSWMTGQKETGHEKGSIRFYWCVPICSRGFWRSNETTCSSLFWADNYTSLETVPRTIPLSPACFLYLCSGKCPNISYLLEMTNERSALLITHTLSSSVRVARQCPKWGELLSHCHPY